jgi:hypothetical protein
MVHLFFDHARAVNRNTMEFGYLADISYSTMKMGHDNIKCQSEKNQNIFVETVTNGRERWVPSIFVKVGKTSS